MFYLFIYLSQVPWLLFSIVDGENIDFYVLTKWGDNDNGNCSKRQNEVRFHHFLSKCDFTARNDDCVVNIIFQKFRSWLLYDHRIWQDLFLQTWNQFYCFYLFFYDTYFMLTKKKNDMSEPDWLIYSTFSIKHAKYASLFDTFWKSCQIGFSQVHVVEQCSSTYSWTIRTILFTCSVMTNLGIWTDSISRPAISFELLEKNHNSWLSCSERQLLSTGVTQL